MDRKLMSSVNCAEVCITQTGRICVASCYDSTEYNTTDVTLTLFDPMWKEAKVAEVSFPVRIGGLGLADVKMFPFNGGKFILLVFGDDAGEFLQIKMFNTAQMEVRNVGIYEPRLWPDIGVSWLLQVSQTVLDSNELVLIEEDQQVLVINICTFELVRTFQFANGYKNRGSLFYGPRADWLISAEHFDAADKFPRMITKVRLSDSQLEFQPTTADPSVAANEGFPHLLNSPCGEEKAWQFAVNFEEDLGELYLICEVFHTESESAVVVNREFQLWRLQLPSAKWTLRATFTVESADQSEAIRMFSYRPTSGHLILLWDSADHQLHLVQRWFEPPTLEVSAQLALAQ